MAHRALALALAFLPIKERILTASFSETILNSARALELSGNPPSQILDRVSY